MDPFQSRRVRLIIGFVRWFCPAYLFEGIEGDLLEAYETDAGKQGKNAASRRLFINSLKFLRPSIILRNRVKIKNPTFIMLRSHFKLTLRNISRSKGYSFINIFGLSLGIACFLLTVNYIVFEFSYDDFHPNIDRTYRVDQTLIWNPEGGVFGSTGPAVAVLLTNDYPEVEEVMRINTPGDYVMRYTESNGNVIAFNENKVFAADSNFFSFFGFELKEGNPKTALQGLNKVVISSEAATKFFGDEPALGKMLQMGNDRLALEVTGVTKPQPLNSHFHFDYLFSMHTNKNIKKFEWSYMWTQVVTYVRLKPNVDRVGLENKLTLIGERVIKPSFAKAGINYDDFMNGKGAWEFCLRPMKDIHLSAGDNRLGPVGDVRYPYAFGAIGIFVLVIAAINFVNLATARGTKRAREVGVKKALGALRSSLISQFQAESIFLALFSLLLAIPLLEALRLIIVALLQDSMPFTLWNNLTFVFMLPVLALVIGFVAGIYPAFYLTSFRPVEVLKGKIATGMGNSGLRNTLVVFQFAVSIALLAGTVVVFQQMNFLRSTNLGFNKENILVVNYADKLGDHITAFRDEVSNLPGVTSASIAMDVPRGNSYEDLFFAEGSNVKLPVTSVKIDDHYFDAMGFTLIAGRLFDVEHNAADQEAFIANETVVKLFGWTPESAIGKVIIYPGNEESRHTIVGVVRDFHFQSLRQTINPLFFNHVNSSSWGDMRVLAVRYETGDLQSLVANIERKWNASVEATPMNFSFLSDDLARNYQEDQRMGDIFGVFASLSIIIAMIGLVGLVAYSAEVRRKEIGIRKVLGASSGGIIVMMNSQYLKLILIGLFVSAPLSWWAMDEWLSTFEFKIDINPIVIVVAGVTVLAIALISVAYLSLRAASVNPASVLKEE